MIIERTERSGKKKEKEKKREVKVSSCCKAMHVRVVVRETKRWLDK